jgi:hypothetical protein
MRRRGGMIEAMKLRRFIAAFVTCCVLAMPTAARAAVEEEVAPTNDARTEGYEQKVQLKNPSAVFAWFVFAPLGIITLGVLFKDAKRTHLD